MRRYDHTKIEKKWQTYWNKKDTYKTSSTSKKPTRYILDMFPYPSGEGVHVGHPKGFIATDIYARHSRMLGYNVLHPMGWDAFGLPAENYALKNKIHPISAVTANVKRYKKQLSGIGLSFDWSREINTTDPEYYKWTQWAFIQMYKQGLAYQSYEPINWCPSCKTGLANEDLEDGRCERCGSEVIQKPVRQWVLRITDYADELLEDLDDLDWPESVKESQRNWIGRSEGAEFSFPVVGKRHYVLIHGYQGAPSKNFFPWLKRELEQRGHTVEIPKLPSPQNPDIEEQIQYVLDTCRFDDRTIVIGHSLGGTVALEVVTRLKHKIEKLVTVAALVEPTAEDRPFADTFDWKFRYDRVRKNANRIVVLRAHKDSSVPAINADIISGATDGELATVTARNDHLTSTREPGILTYCLNDINVFTTRPDTIFGATYMVLAPEHPLVDELRSQITNWQAVRRYRTQTKKKTELQRITETKKKTGVQLEGVYARNPANHEEIPVYIADYVMTGYGTGAIMAVPAHDERDWEFASKFGLPIRQVIKPELVDTENPPRKGVKTKYRHNVMAIVKHPSKNTVLTLNWNHQPWKTFIMGGIEGDEDSVAAARREIKEETGYTDMTFMGQLGQEVHSHFHATHKGENREALTSILVFQLNSMKHVKVSAEEQDKHTPAWSNWDVFSELRHVERGLIEEWFRTGNYAYSGEGILVNSGAWSNTNSEYARAKITDWVGGNSRVTYKLKDWVFSRQRYWGEPIPIVHCERCGTVPVPESELPLKLPRVQNYEPSGTGESPLATIPSFVNTKCPSCGEKARRETNTMPQWAGSCWYYLRYIDPKNSSELVSPSKERHWMPVDTYVGGIEHATRHLIYARFWHKFLYDIGVVSSREPFVNLKNQGMIAGADGNKMSKSKGNVVSPDEVVAQHGADAFRVYEMFMGPFEQGGSWSTDNLVGVRRFLDKVWRMQEKVVAQKTGVAEAKEYVTVLHRTIKKVTNDIDGFDFNTAISAMMVCANAWEKRQYITAAEYNVLVRLLAPFAPYITEELWQSVLGYTSSIHRAKWPKYDEHKAREDEVTIPIQVNGKVRAELSVARDSDQKQVLTAARQAQGIQKWITDQKIKREIYIPNKLVNFVVTKDN